MERETAAAFAETAIVRKLRNFKTEFNEFFTDGNWNIITVLVILLISDLMTLSLNILEPLFAICIGYLDVFTSVNAIVFYEFFIIVLIGGIAIRWGDLGRSGNLIVISWLHAGSLLILFPFVITSMTTCFPDTELPRPFSSTEQYSLTPKMNGYLGPEECPRTINNCSRGYFNRLMIVMILSMFGSMWHSFFYGLRAWKRLSETASPTCSPISRRLETIEEEPSVLSDDNNQSDESSTPRSPTSEGSAAPAPAPIRSDDSSIEGGGVQNIEVSIKDIHRAASP